MCLSNVPGADWEREREREQDPRPEVSAGDRRKTTNVDAPAIASLHYLENLTNRRSHHNKHTYLLYLQNTVFYLKSEVSFCTRYHHWLNYTTFEKNIQNCRVKSWFPGPSAYRPKNIENVYLCLIKRTIYEKFHYLLKCMMMSWWARNCLRDSCWWMRTYLDRINVNLWMASGALHLYFIIFLWQWLFPFIMHNYVMASIL